MDRPRSRRIHAAILAAAAELLDEGGLAAASTDAVARRSGASKATIYNHWPNRLALAVDAFAELVGAEVSPPETGSTRDELATHLALIARAYAGRTGQVYAELLAAAVTDPSGADLLHDRFLNRRRDLFEVAWRRGVERGDIDPALDFQAVNDVMFGPVIFRLISGHAPLSDEAAGQLAAVALDGIAPHAPRGDAPGPSESLGTTS